MGHRGWMVAVAAAPATLATRREQRSAECTAAIDQLRLLAT